MDFLTDPALLIMVSLADEQKHGYAIMKDVEGFSGFTMSPGTLYGAIARLDARGWIEEIQTRNYRRRPYRLTRAGVKALQNHLNFLERLQNEYSFRTRTVQRRDGNHHGARYG
jgi:DNA-binding PadR family transcriptional regulator